MGASLHWATLLLNIDVMFQTVQRLMRKPNWVRAGNKGTEGIKSRNKGTDGIKSITEVIQRHEVHVEIRLIASVPLIRWTI